MKSLDKIWRAEVLIEAKDKETARRILQSTMWAHIDKKGRCFGKKNRCVLLTWWVVDEITAD